MNHQPISTPSQAALDLADLLELRQRQIRRGNTFLTLGALVALVSWFTLPEGIRLATRGGVNAQAGWLFIAISSFAIAAAAAVILAGVRCRRAGLSGSMTPASQHGKANSRFDHVPGSPPASSNAPLNWTGSTLH
ncbi:hypothetical protein F1C58_16695 (plasmid) [Glaciihabitans sp. INWT7]|uniref:hypothetical protein n=1 Tax=Glaciihabitans sp. INWT7 TaxID=2596912 RepID=UPI001628415B|nr:hypothetical protein [Glaciihabitans sp. INWT7]QNE48696.1 hypothetical protein F1C58_16695 [Glaciihabitans sp. INWT7]